MDGGGVVEQVFGRRIARRRAQRRLEVEELEAQLAAPLPEVGALVAAERALATGEVLLTETVYRGRRNLLVRISGYSAYFVDLTPEMQQEIIERTLQAA